VGYKNAKFCLKQLASRAISAYVEPLIAVLKGEHLTRGNAKDDLRMTIGDGECVVTNLTDNRLDCKPPPDKPTKNADDTRCDGDTMTLEVSAIVCCPVNCAEYEISVVLWFNQVYS